MNTKIDNLESKMAQPANNSDVEALQASIKRLESRINGLGENQTAKAEPKAAAPAASPVKSAPVATPAQPATNWTLRGASTNEAFLANKSGEVTTVRVGDTVNGIGRVQSIAVENGKWIVRGTRGVVSQ